MKRVSLRLETSVIGPALGAVSYRGPIYQALLSLAGESHGMGDIIDFARRLVVFFVSGLCVAPAVMLSMKGEGVDQHLAFCPALISITGFVLYYFVHPYVPWMM